MLKVRVHLASGWVDEGLVLLFVHSIFTSRNVRAFFSQIATRISNAFLHLSIGRAADLNVRKIVPKIGAISAYYPTNVENAEPLQRLKEAGQ